MSQPPEDIPEIGSYADRSLPEIKIPTYWRTCVITFPEFISSDQVRYEKATLDLITFFREIGFLVNRTGNKISVSKGSANPQTAMDNFALQFQTLLLYVGGINIVFF